MISRSTISTVRLFEMFPDEESSAFTYVEGRVWANGVQCLTASVASLSPRTSRGTTLQLLQTGFHHPHRDHQRVVTHPLAQVDLRDVSGRHRPQEHFRGWRV